MNENRKLTKADIDKVRHIEGFPIAKDEDIIALSPSQQGDSDDTAVLSSFDHYTTFSYGGRTLTFRTCDGLERYTKVLTWDDGYLEVMARYRQRQEEIEEYIDLDPVLAGLYMDRSFLKPIKKVRIEYA